jgi:hypothetical protein
VTVQAGRGGRRSVGIIHLDEGEAARATRLSIHDHVHAIDRPVAFEERAELRLGGREGEVSDIELIGQTIVLASQPDRPPARNVRRPGEWP